MIEIQHNYTAENIEKILDQIPHKFFIHEKLPGKKLRTRIILPDREINAVINKLKKHPQSYRFKIAIIPIEFRYEKISSI